MNVMGREDHDLTPLLEQLKQLHTIIARNLYIQDVTKRLQRLIEDAQSPPIILFIGRERVGKTTLINALLGREILSSNKMYSTAVNTYIRYGKQEEMKAHFIDGTIATFDISQLELLSTSNSSSSKALRKHLNFLELYLDHELLKQVTLIDSTALEDDSKYLPYFSESLLHSVDELFLIFKCGSTATEAEITLLERLNAKGVQPSCLVNAIDYSRSSLVKYLKMKMDSIGHLTRDFFTVSAKEALESYTYNDSVKWYNSQFESLQNEVNKIAMNSNKKIHQTFRNFFDWLTFFQRELVYLPEREPYASVIKSIEHYSEVAANSVTLQQRDSAIFATFEEAYKHTSEAFQSVETLYHLIQTIEQNPYLQDEATTLYFEQATDYHRLIREYRKIHNEHLLLYEQMDEHHKKLYNKSFMKSLFKIQDVQDDYFKERIECLNELQEQCTVLFADIQAVEVVLLKDLEFIQKHLLQLMEKHLQDVNLKVFEFSAERKQKKKHFKWNIEKLEEFNCLLEAQTFICDVMGPFMNQVNTSLSEQEIANFKSVIAEIGKIQLINANHFNDDSVSKEEYIEVPDFDSKYFIYTLTLIEADIKSDIPPVPEFLQVTNEEAE